ncbi:MAG: hypothetical protein H3C27_08570 [Opitutaceae bacterium]|nr:hypothetical protein [Opitutaceae bacterium]
MGATLAPNTTAGTGAAGLLSAANPLLGLAGGVLGALGPAMAGNAESGTKGNVHFGGISVGSKVVGSGTATTVPAPETPEQAALYSQIAPTGAGSVAANWIPLAGIAALALVLFALIAGSGRRKRRKGEP